MRLFAIILLLLLEIANACVLEIRETTFYVNGTQEVSRDWIVVNFTNEYPYEIYDVQIGEIAQIPAVLPGQNVKIDPYLTLEPIEFPVVFRANFEDLGSKSILEYSVVNLGEEQLGILISFPKFDSFLGCEGCEIDERINFNLSVSPKSSKNFTIHVTRSFQIPDAEVGFKFVKSQNVSFGLKVPMSIEKGNKGEWIARFQTSNPIDREIDLEVNAWADLCGNRVEILNESMKLPPRGIFLNSTELKSACVPIFFFKVSARVEDLCKFEIVPSSLIGGRYVVGYATLKGLSYAPMTPAIPNPPIAGPFAPTPIIPPTIPPTPPQQAQPTPSSFTTGVEVEIPSPRALTFEIAVVYAAILPPATFGAFLAMVFFPVYSRRGIVLSGRDAKIAERLALKIRVYTIPSNPARRGILVEPDREVVSALMSAGLELEDAELIAVAIKVKKPIITRNQMAVRFALYCGVPVVGYGRS